MQTIGSRPALQVLREVLSELDESTRARVGRNLLVGLRWTNTARSTAAAIT